jgi:hypothetical protein
MSSLIPQPPLLTSLSVKETKKQEEPMNKPGWFRGTPEHHARFLIIQEAMEGLE